MWVFKIAPTIVLLYGLSLAIRSQLKNTDNVSEAFDVVAGLAIMSLLVLLWT